MVLVLILLAVLAVTLWRELLAVLAAGTVVTFVLGLVYMAELVREVSS